MDKVHPSLEGPLEYLAQRVIHKMAGYFIAENISWETYQLAATTVKAALYEVAAEEDQRRSRGPGRDGDYSHQKDGRLIPRS